MNRYENVKRVIEDTLSVRKSVVSNRVPFTSLPQDDNVLVEVPPELTVNICEAMDKAFSVLHSQYMRGKIGPVSIEKLAVKAKQELPMAKLWVKTFKQSKIGSFLI